MQYRYEIEHASANFAPAKGRNCIHWYSTRRCSIGMKSSTLPLTSPCSGTKRKTTVPLFFASTGGLRLLSFIPILLLSLKLIKFYSPSLHRFASTHGSDCPSYRPILHQSLQLIDFYSPSLRWFASTGGLGLSLFQTHTPSVASTYWFLQSFASQVCKYPRARIPPLTDLYCICRLRILFFQLITFCFSPIQFLMSKAVIFPSGK